MIEIPNIPVEPTDYGVNIIRLYYIPNKYKIIDDTIKSIIGDNPKLKTCGVGSSLKIFHYDTQKKQKIMNVLLIENPEGEINQGVYKLILFNAKKTKTPIEEFELDIPEEGQSSGLELLTEDNDKLPEEL